MTLGVSLSKTHPIGFQKFAYPTWLRTRKRTDTKKHMETMIRQLSSTYHCSEDKIQAYILPYLLKIQDLEEQSTNEVNPSDDNESDGKHDNGNKKENIKKSMSKREQQTTLFS
jgi:hypothetical protein